MSRNLKFLAVVLVLAGCAGRSLIQEKTDQFVGQPLSAVTAKLGEPTEVRTTDNTQVYIWSSEADGDERSQGKCTIRAIMRGDLVGSFEWEGSESQCAYYALILKGPECRKGLMDMRVWLSPCP